MAHIRQTIRETVIAALVAANTPAGARVLATRKAPMNRAELPALAVYTDSESSEEFNSAPRSFKRTVSLVVVGWAYATANVENDLDDLALAVENAMAVDETFGLDPVTDSVLASTEIGVEVTGTDPMGAVQLTYSLTYVVARPDEGTPADLDPLETAATTYDLDGAQHEDDQAQDEVTFEIEEEDP